MRSANVALLAILFCNGTNDSIPSLDPAAHYVAVNHFDRRADTLRVYATAMALAGQPDWFVPVVAGGSFGPCALPTARTRRGAALPTWPASAVTSYNAVGPYDADAQPRQRERRVDRRTIAAAGGGDAASPVSLTNQRQQRRRMHFLCSVDSDNGNC